MATAFEYDDTDFASGVCNLQRFRAEIAASSIVPGCTLLRHEEATAKVYLDFERDLSAGEVTELDGLVAAHDGTAPDATTRIGMSSSSAEWDLYVDDDGVVVTEEKI